MGIPELLLLFLLSLSLGVALAKHGQPRADFDFRKTFLNFLIIIGLLVWGGFFK